ncbi:MAG: sigma-70 family RNA polymerase sigma factor [Acidobacteria bacterium]|nr:sigma-70 family RNA polymerase sigma factor [Acidobacteriota bacterium]
MGFNHEQAQIADLELVHAIARGDQEAFASLFDRYNSTLLGFLIRILNSKAEAEDVLQEVFVQVWQHAARYDETRGRVFTWMVTIARSRALDRLRSLSSRESTMTKSANQMVQDLPNAVDEAIKSEEYEAIRCALDEIPEAQKHVLLLAYFEGLSHQEIAERDGIPLGTAKTRIRDGLKKLRGLLYKRQKT